MPGSFRLGKIADIEISVHVSWLLILGYLGLANILLGLFNLVPASPWTVGASSARSSGS